MQMLQMNRVCIILFPSFNQTDPLLFPLLQLNLLTHHFDANTHGQVEANTKLTVNGLNETGNLIFVIQNAPRETNTIQEQQQPKYTPQSPVINFAMPAQLHAPITARQLSQAILRFDSLHLGDQLVRSLSMPGHFNLVNHQQCQSVTALCPRTEHFSCNSHALFTGLTAQVQAPCSVPSAHAALPLPDPNNWCFPGSVPAKSMPFVGTSVNLSNVALSSFNNPHVSTSLRSKAPKLRNIGFHATQSLCFFHRYRPNFVHSHPSSNVWSYRSGPVVLGLPTAI